MSNEEILKEAIKLMKIYYDNWNICIEHCPPIRNDRKELSQCVEEIRLTLKGIEN